MEKFKLSNEAIEQLENKLAELSKVFNNNGYDDTAQDIFENVVLEHLDDILSEF